MLQGLLDAQHDQLGFTNGFLITGIVLSLSRTFNRGQRSLDRFKFWYPTSQLLALAVCLFGSFT
ncbi:DUF645 family protein [Vibrio mimicus]